MFFHDLLFGFWVAILITAPVLLIGLIGCKNIEYALVGALVSVLILGLINWLSFWSALPLVGLNKVSIYHEYWLYWWEFVIAVICVSVGAANWDSSEAWPSAGSWFVMAFVVISGGYGLFHLQSVLGNGRAKSLAHQAHVVYEKPQLYPDTDANHILQVPEETADFLANQVLASSSDKKLSTIYNLGKGTLQSVNNHLYWLYGLEPSGWRNSNKVPNAEVPGLVVVDAENPDAHPVLRLKDDNGHGYHLKYYLGGYHWHKLERYLWSHGYRNQLVRGLTLEVNDSWQPFYTASLDKMTVGRNHAVPSKGLVIDPQSGKINQYDIGPSLPAGKPTNLPTWVDRIYTGDVVKNLLNWWGEWGKAKWSLNESSANRYKVSGSPVLVYTKSGHPVWQAILTSWSRDTSAAYLALFDARDNEARIYSISNLTLPSVPEHIIGNSNQNIKNLVPVHLSLHKIYGRLTWVAPLIGASSSQNGSGSQGVALLPYNETNGDNLVIARSMSSALAQYRENLANQNDNSGPEENANNKQASGTVTNLSKVVENGQTVFYFTLGKDGLHVYRAALQTGSSTNQNLELPFIKIGAKVRLTYLDTGVPRRDVGAYDDLGLQVANNG
jgi:hypothetical protein